MDGRVIGEYSQTGQKNIGYVFAGTEVLAWQQFGSVTWKHVDPLTGSSGQSMQSGTFTSTAELDPSGTNIGTTNPFVTPPGISPEPFLPMLTGDEGSCGSNPNCVRCTLAGFEIGCGFIGHMMSGGLVALDPNHPSDSALEKLAAQPIFSTFCVDAIATVGATAPSSQVGMAGATPPAPGDPGARECTTEITGYTEGSLSSGMNLHPNFDQNPQNTNPASLRSHVDNVCSLLVEFNGPGFTEPNGPGESTVGPAVYGLGFTVSGSVVNGAIGTVETEDGIDTVNPKGNWAIQQWESDSFRATYDEVPGRLFYGGKATHPDGPRSHYRLVENQAFVYSDFPGPFKHNDPGNLTYFEGEFDFDIKLINGSQQCEVKFHVSMSFRHRNLTANWRGR